MEIVPSILESTQEDFVNTLKKLLPYFKHFQIDIQDGEFVKNKTISIESVRKALSNIQSSQLKELIFDFDLAVADPKMAIEAIDDLENIIKVDAVFVRPIRINDYSKLAQLYPEMKIGLALDPGDSVDTITEQFDLEKVPVIQIMTVEPGPQGQMFIEDMLNKIEQLRMNDYRNKIYLDGGINEKTLRTINSKKYLPDYLGPGSYLTKAGNDLKKRVENLKKILP